MYTQSKELEHIQSRLKERQLKFSDIFLLAIAKECERDTAVLLLDTGVEKCPTEREESNGNYVILIVRNKLPVTVMYRRSNQPFTPEALRVETLRVYDWR